MWARWWSFTVWALVAGSALFWGLRLFVTAPQVPAQAVVAELGAGARGDLSRVFGPDPVAAVEAAEPEPVAQARFQLIGVISPRGSQAAGQGVALIVVDGKPAKAYRVGTVVDGQTVLQSVRPRGAALGPRGGAVQVALDIAAPAAAATGVLGDPSMNMVPVLPLPAVSRNAPPPSGTSTGPARAPTVPPPQLPTEVPNQGSPSMVPATR